MPRSHSHQRAKTKKRAAATRKRQQRPVLPPPKEQAADPYRYLLRDQRKDSTR